MTRVLVDTSDMLRRCQLGLRSEEPHIVEAAESVMSALTYNLRYEQALLPEELQGQINALRKHTDGCKVRNTRKTSTRSN